MKLISIVSLLCVFAHVISTQQVIGPKKFNKQFKNFRSSCGDKNAIKRRGCSEMKEDGSVTFHFPTEPQHIENMPHVLDMGEFVNKNGILLRGYLMPLTLHMLQQYQTPKNTVKSTRHYKEEIKAAAESASQRILRRLQGRGNSRKWNPPPTPQPTHNPTVKPTLKPTPVSTQEAAAAATTPHPTTNALQTGCWSCVRPECPLYSQKSGFEVHTLTENVGKVSTSLQMWKDIIGTNMPLDECSVLGNNAPMCGDTQNMNYPDGVNVISDVEMTNSDGICDSAVLGVTMVYATSYAIFETDIALNLCFNFGDADIGLNPGELDYISVLTHEIGHAMGLGHSNDDPRGCEAETGRLGREEIMYYAYTGVYRQVWGGDIQGITTLYG